LKQGKMKIVNTVKRKIVNITTASKFQNRLLYDGTKEVFGLFVD
jgi:hypothetical protein